MSDVTRMPTTLLLAASLTHRSPGSSLNQVLPSTHGVWQHVQPPSGVAGTEVSLGGCAPGQRAQTASRVALIEFPLSADNRIFGRVELCKVQRRSHEVRKGTDEVRTVSAAHTMACGLGI